MVTTRRPDGRPCGLTANAVASLSLEPRLVLACVEQSADTHDCILSAGFFAVCVLAHDQERSARHFADTELIDKFDGIAFREERTGAPILENALAWVDCLLKQTHSGGDHSIFVGTVEAGGAAEGTPLLYYRGGYAQLAP